MSNDSSRNNSSKPIIAVTMATSRQGVAVVKNLSESGLFNIRAISRSTTSKKSIFLSKLTNVEVIKGDLLIKDSLEKCFLDVYGIFGNTTPTKGWTIGRGSIVSDYELEQGRNLIDAVNKIRKRGNLKHFIFSSICKAKDPLKNNPTPSHFASKWSIEEYILKTGLEKITTILRPVSYFENFITDLPGIEISQRKFPGIISKEKVWQTIAVDDIGKWTKAIFKNPERFLGESINIAGEEMTGDEMAEILQKIACNEKTKVRYSMVPRIILRLLEHDLLTMAKWIERAGYGADLKYLKDLSGELEVNMTPLSSWLKTKVNIKKHNRKSFQSRIKQLVPFPYT